MTDGVYDTGAGGSAAANADPEAVRLCSRWTRLKRDRSLFDELFREVATWIMPRRQGFFESPERGQKLQLELFDSTAPRANRTLAAAVHGALTTTQMSWFGLRFRQKKLNQLVAARRWLDECTQLMHSALAESNFDGEAVEYYEDLFGFGTACLLHEEQDEEVAQRVGFQGFSFRALPLTDYWVREDRTGRVAEVFLELRMDNQSVVEWPGFKVTDRMLEEAKSDPEKPRSVVLHIKFNRKARRVPVGQLAGPTQRRWLATYVDPKEKLVLKRDGYYELPVHITRIGKKSGEVYGRGIGIDVLPDVKTLNKAKELGLKAWEKVLDPPLKRRHKGVMGRVRTYAGGITDVRRMEDLQALYDSNAFRFDVSELKHRDLQMAIERAYFIDQLQLPPVQESKTMSATEVEVRYEQMQKLLGPSLGAIVYEFMNPLIVRCFAMMLRKDALPPPPPELLELSPGIDVEYVGPFSRAQKMSNVVAIQRWLGDLVAVAEINPEVMDGVDWDAYRKELADRYGVPAAVQRSEDEVQQIRQARAEQMARQAEMEQALAAAEVQNKTGR